MKNLAKAAMAAGAAMALSLGALSVPGVARPAWPSVSTRRRRRRAWKCCPRHAWATWAPGHWEWVGGHHAWIGGVWMPARPGYVYHGPEWRQRHGQWVYYEGRWGRH